MIFTEGVVHCDLHPGNLALGPGDLVTLVDFGLTAELGADDRRAFAELFYAMAENDGELAARIAIETAVHRPPGFDRPGFTRDVCALIAEASGALPADFQVAAFAGRLIDLQRRHGLHSTTAFTMPIMALLTLEGTIKGHAPSLDFQALARPFVMPALMGSTRVPLAS
jgi:ubiquinone biosynthesis protein